MFSAPVSGTLAAASADQAGNLVCAEVRAARQPDNRWISTSVRLVLFECETKRQWQPNA